MNCMGYILGRDEDMLPKCWSLETYNKVSQFINQNTEGEEVALEIRLRMIDEILATMVAAEFCSQYQWREIITTPTKAPEGTVALRVGTVGLFSDFHFAIKSEIDGETCWLHKPGQCSVDIMFDDEIAAPEWDGGYRTTVRYFQKIK